jgi:hypothetical protein
MYFDPEDEVTATYHRDHEQSRKIYAPSKRLKVRSFTVICLILNRTIGKIPNTFLQIILIKVGSGIFLTPSRALRGSGSPGISLILWALGGLVSIAAVLVWLEFGLTIPRELAGGRVRSVPRSGGEKNYVSEALFLLYSAVQKAIKSAGCFIISWLSYFGEVTRGSIIVLEISLKISQSTINAFKEIQVILKDKKNMLDWHLKNNSCKEFAQTI